MWPFVGQVIQKATVELWNPSLAESSLQVRCALDIFDLDWLEPVAEYGWGKFTVKAMMFCGYIACRSSDAPRPGQLLGDH